MDSNKHIIVLMGKSGSGKTTIEKMLLKKKNFRTLLIYTTREKRPGEVNGVDYNFVSNEAFKKIKFDSKFIVNENWKYGVDLEYLKNIENNIFVFSPISEQYSLDTITSALNNGFTVDMFILTVDKETRIERLLSRGESQESINKRFEIEEEEGEYSSRFDFLNPTIIDTGTISLEDSLQKILKELPF